MTDELKNIKELDECLLANDYVIVDFYTANCVPCKILSPVFDLVATKYETAKFYKYNAENLSDIERFNIKAVPSILFFKNGQEVHRIIGIKSQTALETVISTMLYTKNDYFY